MYIYVVYTVIKGESIECVKKERFVCNLISWMAESARVSQDNGVAIRYLSRRK